MALRYTPLPSRPRFEVRDLVLSLQSSGKKTCPTSINGLRLVILIPDKLYVVAKDFEDVRRGEVIYRNLALTRQTAGCDNNPDKHHFVRCRGGVYHGIRTLAHIQGQYDQKLPKWRKNQRTLQHLQKMSWMLRGGDAGVRRELHAHTRPLIWSSDHRLGHRWYAGTDKQGWMDWRAVALARYADRLHWWCLTIDDAAIKRWHDPQLFDPNARSHKYAGNVAHQMRDFADRLLMVSVRPFQRSLHHTAEDFMEAAGMLDACHWDQAQAVLGRIHRSMALRPIHQRLEEVLMIVSRLRRLNGGLVHWDRISLCMQLRSAHDDLRANDTVCAVDKKIGVPLNYDFHGSRDVFPRVKTQLSLARRELGKDKHDLQVVYEHLKNACASL